MAALLGLPVPTGTQEIELIEAGYTVIRWTWADLQGAEPSLLRLLRRHLPK